MNIISNTRIINETRYWLARQPTLRDDEVQWNNHGKAKYPEFFSSLRLECAMRARNWKAKYPEFFSSLRLECAMRARMWAALKGRTDGALFSRLGYR
jgi:hypothetical protein